MAAHSTALVINLDQLGKDDIEMVGGKNASLGEMISHLSDLGVSVPGGFATTSNAFNRFLNETGLLDKINSELKTLDINDVNKLAATGKKSVIGLSNKSCQQILKLRCVNRLK
jgi:pyruvate,water dikinase